VTDLPSGRPVVVVDLDALARRLARLRVLLCLDYDGTLVPIAARPHLAMFDDAGRRLLRTRARRVPRPALAGRTPVYVGDDITDEDAFLAVRRDGVGVLVGRPRRSAARYRFSGPAEVRSLLVRWLQALDRRGTVRARAL
jgi:trehalose-6-phosphatase